ncbi:hypothetical protein Ancab_018596 [Ancistrocladus abbreviatus]
MASLMADKHACCQQPAGQVKKESAGAAKAPASKPAPKKAEQKPREPKTKGTSAKSANLKFPVREALQSSHEGV